MESSALTFAVEIDVPSARYDDLFRYINQYFILPSKEHFANVKQTLVDGATVISFTFLSSEGNWPIDVEIKTGKPIQVTMRPNLPNVPQATLDILKGDLTTLFRFFEENVRRSTLYFTFIEGQKVKAEKSFLKRARILERILLGNILFLFIISIIFSIALFLIVPVSLYVLVIVVITVVLVTFSSRIVGGMADWRVTEQNQNVHVLQYNLPPEVYMDFPRKFSREKLLQMKGEIYDKTLAAGKPIECGTVQEVMSKYGLECRPENVTTKTVNVYQLVEKTAQQYNLPIPKIAIANTMIPNAAASGISPSHGVVLITTGLLVQLKADEILTVLGHEFSHLKARDQLAIPVIYTTYWVFQFYVLAQYLVSYFSLLYLFLVYTGFFFIFKFFEARADLDAAITIGSPKILAEALRKIGFRRLESERTKASRIGDWITWNTHPPIYFRVARLDNYAEKPVEVKHTLYQSAKDCLHGFVAAF
ncbi:MAG TPA: M48 family metalloprotease [archaeon]|nr:M48 family metalloprotease [archaeon]